MKIRRCCQNCKHYECLDEEGERHVIVRTEDNPQDPTVVVLPASIVKSKFTDAAFIRCITNFFIKD